MTHMWLNRQKRSAQRLCFSGQPASFVSYKELHVGNILNTDHKPKLKQLLSKFYLLVQDDTIWVYIDLEFTSTPTYLKIYRKQSFSFFWKAFED